MNTTDINQLRAIPNTFGCRRVTGEQKALLIDFMKKHPELVSGKFTASFTLKNAQHLWDDVSKDLNAMPGAVKDWKQWRKTWQDIRAGAKSKHANIRKHILTTGGGPSSSQNMTAIDETVLSLISSTSIEGHKTVQESDANFDWTQELSAEYIDDDHDDNDEILEIPISRQTINKQRRYDESITQTRKLAKISEEDHNTKKEYYKQKVLYYQRKLELKERDVCAKEKIASLLEQCVQKFCKK